MHADQNILTGWLASDDGNVVGGGLNIVVTTDGEVTVGGWKLGFCLKANAVVNLRLSSVALGQVVFEVGNSCHRKVKALRHRK